MRYTVHAQVMGGFSRKDQCNGHRSLKQLPTGAPRHVSGILLTHEVCNVVLLSATAYMVASFVTSVRLAHGTMCFWFFQGAWEVLSEADLWGSANLRRFHIAQSCAFCIQLSTGFPEKCACVHSSVLLLIWQKDIEIFRLQVFWRLLQLLRSGSIKWQKAFACQDCTHCHSLYSML